MSIAVGSALLARRCTTILILALTLAACGRPDKAIAADVRSRLAALPALRNASISAVVKKGVVVLRGDVSAATQPPLALAAVENVDGVRHVINQLTLRDDAIRLAVEQALKKEPLLEHVAIDVSVTDGVVRLTSSVTSAPQRTLAVSVARALPGVVHVEDDMK